MSLLRAIDCSNFLLKVFFYCTNCTKKATSSHSCKLFCRHPPAAQFAYIYSPRIRQKFCHFISFILHTHTQAQNIFVCFFFLLSSSPFSRLGSSKNTFFLSFAFLFSFFLKLFFLLQQTLDYFLSRISCC